MKYDVVVIGMGMSGLVAASKAISKGKNTLLVAKGQGALSITSGCLDFWGYCLDNPETIAPNPYEEIRQLIIRNPEHPYAKVFDILQESIDFFKEIIGYSGYRLVGDITDNQHVLTSLGTVHPSAFVPASMIIKKREMIKKVIAVGFTGYGDFYPQMYLDNLEENMFPKAQKISQIIDLEINADLKSNSLAHLLTKDEILNSVINELRQQNANQCDRKEYFSDEETLFVFPSVLGEQPNYNVWERLTTELSAQVIEVPGLPPSIPGQRLDKALTIFLSHHGAEFRHNTQVIGFNAKDRKVTSIIVQDSSHSKHIIEAKSFILATGSFWGGGLIDKKNVLYEPIFNLEVYAPNQFNDTPFFSLNGQPFLSSGIEVDNLLRPNPNLENLYSAGSILAHCNYSMEKNGLGLALATGYKAGSNV
ncbi:anaerobic glycerol-3-phosphate dehydrogenase subunit GlpB [Desulfitobacterium sp.]|uniref:anaerobic glycerol-3-phosphate dehydrogenase subunit GlpB n=1 Tax=Desulfitobacterium sp. TaxID=49981 RepID=UPI002B1FF3D6|nr:anaerobic glycerol-3-phosphate dehydrogenase subunit GlpB [Desulfitobacterium sp.]MEA4903044.1 anaerobic glycerol-3-phosphate dehydrogenase subunit GlpB [Desulfitobacterium sp.]